MSHEKRSATVRGEFVRVPCSYLNGIESVWASVLKRGYGGDASLHESEALYTATLTSSLTDSAVWRESTAPTGLSSGAKTDRRDDWPPIDLSGVFPCCMTLAVFVAVRQHDGRCSRAAPYGAVIGPLRWLNSKVGFSRHRQGSSRSCFGSDWSWTWMNCLLT